MKQSKTIDWSIVPVFIFMGIFWFKNGFIDKVCGVLLGWITPSTAYQGDTWSGWASYIVGTWDKSQVAHAVLSPVFPVMFPILIVLQCLPFIFCAKAIVSGEFLTGRTRLWLKRSAVASLFVNGIMLFSQTLAGASDGKYLWQLLAFNMIAIMYIETREKA
ncbi:TPA: hypothetical protein ACRZZI_004980 [Vibrio harveyi]